jgi:hypothetical protein
MTIFSLDTWLFMLLAVLWGSVPIDLILRISKIYRPEKDAIQSASKLVLVWAPWQVFIKIAAQFLKGYLFIAICQNYFKGNEVYLLAGVPFLAAHYYMVTQSRDKEFSFPTLLGMLMLLDFSAFVLFAIVWVVFSWLINDKNKVLYYLFLIFPVYAFLGGYALDHVLFLLVSAVIIYDVRRRELIGA